MENNFIRKTIVNNGVEIEYYTNNKVNNKPSLVISMGVWEPAFRAFPLISRLSDTHCIVLSYRGRGGSSTPEFGYDFSHHASDLACVLDYEPINNPVFLGFSKGVSYMLGYLSNNISLAKSVIIIDYPAIHSKADKGYGQFWYNMIYDGIKLKDHISLTALEGIEKESTYREFYVDLNNMNCPIYLFRGTCESSLVPSNLAQDDILKYKSSIEKLKIIDFKYSGHMIIDEELGKVCSNVTEILSKI